MMDLYLIFAFFSFAAGACVASFLNVVIWRVPRGESIVSPPSHCPKCDMRIRWWQNIPIVSYLALRGRCAKCHSSISPRYAVVEIIGGVLFLSAFRHLVPEGEIAMADLETLLVWWIWIALMIAGSFIDFDYKLLPDFTTVGGMALGVAHGAFGTLGSAFSGKGFSSLVTYIPLSVSLLGLAFGFGLLYLVRFLGSKAFGREAMGMGDVFLMGAVGAIFGPVAVLATLILSSLFGSIAGVSAIIFSKTKLGRFVEIPYGPYICMGSLVWMFHGDEILNWYLRMLK